MSLIKDWYKDNKDYTLSHKAGNLFSMSEWKRLHTHRKQRADRGWSNRDTWGAGEHIAKITADMLQHLNDHTYVDWPEWFKLNVQEAEGYKNLQAVIDDINNYLAFTETTWGDDLETTGALLNDDNSVDICFVYKKSGRKVSKKQISALIKKHHDKEAKLYKKATDAMQFFGRHFASFWD